MSRRTPLADRLGPPRAAPSGPGRHPSNLVLLEPRVVDLLTRGLEGVTVEGLAPNDTRSHTMDTTQKNLQSRFDRQALDQLRTEVTRLAEHTERLEQALARAEECLDWAEQDAELWRSLYQEAAALADPDRLPTPGITQSGQLVTVAPTKGN